jgi:hypothetical protein
MLRYLRDTALAMNGLDRASPPVKLHLMLKRAWPVLLALGCSAEPAEPGTTDPGPFADAPFRPVAAYPPGPYGRGIGAVIENLSFLGWKDPARSGYDPGALETVSLSEFYDPTGTRTKLIVLNASAVWCTVCRAEMQDIRTRDVHRSYKERGVELVGTLFEDAKGGPAQPSDLQLWGSTAAHDIKFPLLLDPGFKASVYFTSDATPLNMIIDATTMRIVYTMMGYDSRVDSGLWAIVDRVLADRGGSPAP